VAYSGAIEGEKRERAALKELRDEKKSLGGRGMMPGAATGAFGFKGGKDAYANRTKEMLGRRLDLGGSGVSTAATAAKLGDFFQYAIDKPVTLGRQKSALLPIVGK